MATDPTNRVIIYDRVSWNDEKNYCQHCKKKFVLQEKIFSKRSRHRKRYCLDCAKRLCLLVEEKI